MGLFYDNYSLNYDPTIHVSHPQWGRGVIYSRYPDPEQSLVRFNGHLRWVYLTECKQLGEGEG